MTEPSKPHVLALTVARALGEEQPGPQAQLKAIAARIGAERCVRLLEQTLCVQDKGGLLCPDGTRQRTPGGVFFWLARGSVTYEERCALFPPPQHATAETPRTDTDRAWWHNMTEVRALAHELRGHAGRTEGMKLTLIGRPSGVAVRTSTVAFVLDGARPPALPKGMPPPGQAPPCLVVVGRKQWERVSTALDDPAESLIIEGYPTLDPRFADGLTVHATRVTTKAQMASARSARPTPATGTA